MKTIPALAFLAALAAFFALPLPFETAASVLVAAAVTAITVSDYARTRPRLQYALVTGAPVAAVGRTERLRLAA